MRQTLASANNIMEHGSSSKSMTRRLVSLDVSLHENSNRECIWRSVSYEAYAWNTDSVLEEIATRTTSWFHLRNELRKFLKQFPPPERKQPSVRSWNPPADPFIFIDFYRNGGCSNFTRHPTTVIIFTDKSPTPEASNISRILRSSFAKLGDSSRRLAKHSGENINEGYLKIMLNSSSYLSIQLFKILKYLNI